MREALGGVSHRLAVRPLAEVEAGSRRARRDRAAVRSLVVPLSCFALLLSAGAAAAAGTAGSADTPAAGVPAGATTSPATSVTTSARVTTTTGTVASPSTGSSAVLGTLTLTRRSTAHADARASGFALSTPAIALAALAAALVLLSLGWALARAVAYEPVWMPALRHSFAEAGFRASATWAELWDWLRLGR